MQDRKLKVFLCYAPGDRTAVRELYRQIAAEAGTEPWMDVYDILPGEDRDLAIEKALEDTDIVIVCISNKSIGKEGPHQKEITDALKKSREKPEGTIFVIPLCLDDCEVPRNLRNWQWVNYFEADGFSRLLQSFRARASQLGIIAFSGLQGLLGGIDFMKVPEGKFIMGSLETDKLAYEDEMPQHELHIPYYFLITRYEITNVQYSEFLKQTEIESNSSAKRWRTIPDLPVTKITWYEAVKFCNWMNDRYSHYKQPDFVFRLPTEAEWEKAARGVDGRKWPWGNRFSDGDEDLVEDMRCNCRMSQEGKPIPVDAYVPKGDSPYRVSDMVGNVWEWTQSLLKPYPYDPKDGRENPKTPGERVIRGGAFDKDRKSVRSACRSRLNPGFHLASVGFRVVYAPPIVIG